MICLACKRRVDPNRSFCRNCGSSVFIEKSDAASFLARYADPTDAPPVPVPAPPERSKRAAASKAPATRRLKQTKTVSPEARAAAAAAASGMGCVMSLIRFAVFAAIVYYGISALLRIPEVAAIKNAIQSGNTEELNDAIDRLRQRIPGPNENRDRAPQQPALDPAALPLPDAAPTAADDPAQVYSPGNGVTMPSPTVRVNPSYTPDALRRGIEGSVLLRCVVRPDFTVSDITVIRSLDPGLDAEAVKALSQWRFTPGRREGRFVAVAITIEMRFAPPQP